MAEYRYCGDDWRIIGYFLATAMLLVKSLDRKGRLLKNYY